MANEIERLEFTRATKEAALDRQDNRCASCAAWINRLGGDGLGWVIFGEWVQAHHVVPAISGGDASLANCVIICKACHYSAHGGGAFKQSKESWMKGSPSDYPCYHGTKAFNPRGIQLAREMDKRFNNGPLR